MTQKHDDSETPVAVVTGAGSGIGASIAQALTSEGWVVVGWGRRMDALESTAASCSGRMVPMSVDVTNWEQVRAAEIELPNNIDALIHSAGLGNCLDIDELEPGEWQQVLDVAATGAFYTAKALLPKLRNGGATPGHIIQIASMASGGTWCKEIGYGTAKGAQVKFHQHLSNQLHKECDEGGRKIYSHAICPGTVATPFWERIPQRRLLPEEALHPEEVAWLVLQVLSHPESSPLAYAGKTPRPEVHISHHAPWLDDDSIFEIKHQAHD